MCPFIYIRRLWKSSSAENKLLKFIHFTPGEQIPTVDG